MISLIFPKLSAPELPRERELYFPLLLGEGLRVRGNHGQKTIIFHFFTAFIELLLSSFNIFLKKANLNPLVAAQK